MVESTGEFFQLPNNEASMRQTIVGWSEKYVENPQLNELMGRVNQISTSRTEIEKRAVEVLGTKDPSVSKITHDLSLLHSFMENIAQGKIPIGSLDPNGLEDWDSSLQLIDNLEKDISNTSLLPVLNRLKTYITGRNEKKIKDLARKTAEYATDPKVVWRELVKRNVITEDFFAEMKDTMAIVEMSKKWEVVEEYISKHSDMTPQEIKALRARAFISYMQKEKSPDSPSQDEYTDNANMSPSFIESIVNGEIDMGKEFVDATVSMYTQYEEETHKKNSSRSKLPYMVAAAATTCLLASSTPLPISESGIRNYAPIVIKNEDTNIPVYLPIVIKDEDKYPPENPQVNISTSPANSDPSNSNGELNGPQGRNPPDQQSRQSASPSESDAAQSTRETNSSVENSSPNGYTEVWKLKGSQVKDFYRVDTEAVFKKTFENKFAWFSQGRKTALDGSITYIDHRQKELTGDEVIEGDFNLENNNLIDLPMRYGYVISPDKIQVSKDGKLLASQVTLVKDPQGNYFIQFNRPDGVNGKVKVEYVLDHSDDKNLIPYQPDPIFKSPLIESIDNLPSLAREKFQEVNNDSSLSPKDKVEMLRKWIAGTFTYSLDKEYSDYYQRAKTPGEFIGRIFNKERGDCDVVNTAFLALVRELGIPSRMAIGYLNTGGAMDLDSNALASSEQHAIVEAYVDGKWLPFDATPSQIDEKSLDMIKKYRGDNTDKIKQPSESGNGEVNPDNSNSAIPIEKLDAVDKSKIPDKAIMQILTIGDFLRDAITPDAVTTEIAGIYLFMVARSVIQTSKLKKMADKAYESSIDSSRLAYGMSGGSKYLRDVLNRSLRKSYTSESTLIDALKTFSVIFNSSDYDSRERRETFEGAQRRADSIKSRVDVNKPTLEVENPLEMLFAGFEGVSQTDKPEKRKFGLNPKLEGIGVKKDNEPVSTRTEGVTSIAELSDIDPLDLVIEISGVDHEVVENEALKLNANNILLTMVQDIEGIDFIGNIDELSVGDIYLNRGIRNSIFPGNLLENDRQGKLRLLLFLKNKPIEKVMENYLARAYGVYKQEADLREKARNIPQNKRKGKMRSKADQRPLILTKEEFRENMTKSVLPQLAALWHVAISS